MEKELEAVQYKRATHDRVKEVFNLLDVNSSLRLSKDVLAHALGMELAERIIMKMDTDKDGRVSLTEWMGFFEHMGQKAAMQDMPNHQYYKHVAIFVDVVLNRLHHRQGQWGTNIDLKHLPMDSEKNWQAFMDLV